MLHGLLTLLQLGSLILRIIHTKVQQKTALMHRLTTQYWSVGLEGRPLA